LTAAGKTPTIQPAADQLMRRLLHSVGTLQATCARDLVELRAMQESQRASVQAAERTARNHTEQAIASAVELGDRSRSLGSRLRATLGALDGISFRHLDAGQAPESFDDAVAEWKRAAPALERWVAEYVRTHRAWTQKTFKRSKSRPQVTDDVWRGLDRLDLVHHSVSSLTQGFIAEAVKEAAGPADVLYAAEAARRTGEQERLANDVRAAVAAVNAQVRLASATWADDRWATPEPAERVERLIRLGDLVVDVPANLGIETIPALCAFPLEAGLAVGSNVSERDRAIGFLRALMLRILAATPPGGVHIKAIDPVSLGQSVAEFRHLSEFDDQLMDEKTWTSDRDIERQLDGLSDYLEVVISKYLRGQFETIDEYNTHAGEVAQPYRLLTVFDYPAGFTERASRQLLSLIENGPRCGVFTVIHYDKAARGSDVFGQVPIERLIHSMQQIDFVGGPGAPAGDARGETRINLGDPIGEVTLQLLADVAPPLAFDEHGRAETGFARLLPQIGDAVRRAKESPPVVTLESLLPVLERSRGGNRPEYVPGAPIFTTDPDSWWFGTTSGAAIAPLGRSGAQGVTSMQFSSTEVAGGAIMIGLPRSGKSTNLHAMIMTMSMLYSPEELELYLIDSKHGVEFEIYRRLPHARMVSVHSDREFSVAVLKSIQNEVRNRAELFKAAGSGIANISEYRAVTGEKLPRIVVVMDEFHEVFEEQDTLGFSAFGAFSDIVRMGPFAGVHIVVSSQNLSAMPAMDRQTLMLLPQRVAFQCNDEDADVVLGPTNRAHKQLTRKGEGVYNPTARGDEARNELFQGLLIPREPRASILDTLRAKADASGWTRRPRVFDGAAVVARPPFADVLAGSGRAFAVPVGEPFNLQSAEVIKLPRARGGNLLLLGDRLDEGVSPELRGVLHSLMVAAHLQGARVTVLDLGGEDFAPEGSVLSDVAGVTGARYLRSPAFETAVAELALITGNRNADQEYKASTELLVIVGLQRALSLTPFDPYGDGEMTQVSELLQGVLHGGPDVGVHVVVVADRAFAVEQRLGELATEFSIRVVGSAADEPDLRLATGRHGELPVLALGQLLVCDVMSGSAKRVRGYGLLKIDSQGSKGESRE
jgi:S-DNA-T family DNA segregation ATPase FtsK/SpoIIIE